MAAYTDIPTLDRRLVRPAGVMFDTVGGGQEGPRNGLGQSITISLTGGPHVVATYRDCTIHDPEEFEYFNRLGARLNDGLRFINVPIINDWMLPAPLLNGIPQQYGSPLFDPDGSLVDGATGFAPTVTAEITTNAAVNAGFIYLRVKGAARLLRHSAWFSIYHAVLGWRAYRVWEIDNIVDEGTSTLYTLSISPPLREAVAATHAVEIVAPRFVGKFPPGFTVALEASGFWVARSSLQFAEAW